MKSAILLTLLGLIVLVASEGSDWGFRQPGDRLVEAKTYTKSSFPLKKQVMDVEYRGNSVITYIRAIDNKSGGSASILKGGVGTSHAIIHLKSGRGKGLNFTVQIYAR